MRPTAHNLVARGLAGAAFVLATFIVLLLPTAAHAFTDDKTVPATSCRRMDTTAPQGVLGVRTDGTIENDSAVNGLQVICPIVRDTTQSTGSWSIAVRVDDKTNVGAVSCVTTSRTSFGGFADDSGTVQTAVGGIAQATLNMTVDPQSADGYSLLKCTIPPSQAGNRSKIIAYTTFEPNDADTGTDRKTYTGHTPVPSLKSQRRPPECRRSSSIPTTARRRPSARRPTTSGSFR